MKIVECPKCQCRKFDFLEIEPPKAKLKCKSCGAVYWEDGKTTRLVEE